MSDDKSRAKAAGEELTGRQRCILSAIVREHVATKRPVGSKALAKCEELSVSSATIRNEMAELDQRGYLYQPHTSAGRVPSEKAYRFHVNHLAAYEKLPLDKLSWIHSQYRRVEPDADKILRLSTKLLADIVKHPAVALEPGRGGDRPVEIEAWPVSAHTVRLLCTYSAGRRQEFVVRSAESITVEQVEQLAGAIRHRLSTGSSTRALDSPAGGTVGEADIPADLLRAVWRQLWAGAGSRVYVEGTAYILEAPEFQDLSHLQAVVETLGEQRALRELLSMAAEGAELSVIIGSEHAMPRLEQCSSVLSTFTGRSDRRGILGVLGPMRMEYDEVIPAVECVAEQAGAVLAGAETG